MMRTRNLLWLALGTAILIALPLVVKRSFAIDIFIRILLFAFIGVAWNLMGGYAKRNAEHAVGVNAHQLRDLGLL